jgi:hypothetical protein
MEPWIIIDAYFCSVCDTPDEQLNPESVSLVRVWHSFGSIENGGLHGYLCEVGDEALELAKHYRSIGIETGALLIEQGAGLWRRYWHEDSPDNSNPDDFRRLFHSELNEIESNFYGLEDSVIAALLPIAQRNTKFSSPARAGSLEEPEV